MYRLAIHESAAANLSPTQLIGVAQQSGFDSIGLRVAHSPGADRWWHKGAGAEELRGMVDRLLASRVSVLDVGRVELGEVDLAATTESYRSVLDLASRLGAHYVTAAAVTTDQHHAAIADLFSQLVSDCDTYQLIPLLVPQPGTAVETLGTALGIVRQAGGAVVVNASTAQSAWEIESLMLEAGNRLGYLRLQAEELDVITEDAAAGLLATVPAHVPIAVGSPHPGVATAGDLLARARRWNRTIDRMLEHPRAREAREQGC